jgi:hypothetical protein
VILKFLEHLSTVILKSEPSKLDDLNLKHFVCATIRVLGAWLSEETATMREEVTFRPPARQGLPAGLFSYQKSQNFGRSWN